MAQFTITILNKGHLSAMAIERAAQNTLDPDNPIPDDAEWIKRHMDKTLRKLAEKHQTDTTTIDEQIAKLKARKEELEKA